ncbi:MAG: amidohydrolase [Verrucomicrobia bacterium]|nr:amidohydrolase [Verrucomicrobiota bacterium]
MPIDAHQHFWKYDAGEYLWITEEKNILRRDYLPEDLEKEQAKVQFDGSIAVQARQTLEESHWLLKLADRNDRIKGVVGWVDLGSDRVVEQLETFAAHLKFVGVRHVVQDEPDDRFILRPEFLCGLEMLKRFDLTYDLLIYPRQLPAALEVVSRFPEQPFVLDHLAKPQIKDRVLSPWKEQIQELAAFPNVFCKISGMVTEADWRAWKPEDFTPYLDVVSETFGEDRLMVGSDWPVCLLAASYAEVVALARDYFKSLSEAARKKIFGENACKFYGIGCS